MATILADDLTVIAYEQSIENNTTCPSNQIDETMLLSKILFNCFTNSCAYSLLITLHISVGAPSICSTGEQDKKSNRRLKVCTNQNLPRGQ